MKKLLNDYSLLAPFPSLAPEKSTHQVTERLPLWGRRKGPRPATRPIHDAGAIRWRLIRGENARRNPPPSRAAAIDSTEGRNGMIAPLGVA
jgi:hypothetical protein